MQFKRLSKNDKDILDKYIRFAPITSDYSIAGFVNWDDMWDVEIAFDDASIYIKGIYKGQLVFLPPLCSEAVFKEKVQRIIEYCFEQNIPPVIILLTNKQTQYLPDGFCIKLWRHMSEYVYAPSELIGLAGKKYHSKRNFIAQFKEKYKYTFREYEPKDYNGVKDLIKNWWNDEDNVLCVHELKSVDFMFSNLSKLSLTADVVLVDDKVIALSIVEVQKSGLGIVLYEKAYHEYTGVYAFINQAVVEKRLSECTFINRQEDIGIDGLRKAKLSYHPSIILDKYAAFYNYDKQKRELYKDGFPNDSESFMEYMLDNSLSIENAAIKLNDGVPTSIAYIKPKKLNCGGRIVGFSYLYAVSTITAMRGKREIESVIKECFVRSYYAGCPIIALYPFKHSYYEKYGFDTIYAPFVKLSMLKSTEEILCDEYSLIESKSINNMLDIYNKVAQTYDTYIARDTMDMNNRLNELYSGGGKSYVIVKKQGDIIGYALIGDVVEECVINTHDFTCLKSLKTIACATEGFFVTGPYGDYKLFDDTISIINKPQVMLRVVNPTSYLEGRLCDKFDNFTLKICDNLIKDTYLKLKYDNGVIKAIEIAPTITNAELSSAELLIGVSSGEICGVKLYKLSATFVDVYS